MGCVKLGTVAAAAVCLAVAVLLPGCSRSTCVEPEVEPEPKIPIMTYAFRQMVPMCMGCDPCWSLYWYFECEGDDVTFIGHWDPRDGGGAPDWLEEVHAGEALYDDWNYSSPDTTWGEHETHVRQGIHIDFPRAVPSAGLCYDIRAGTFRALCRTERHRDH